LKLLRLKAQEAFIDKENKMYLSNQALGTIMICLQKALVEEQDIVPMLKKLVFVESGEGLLVSNPPEAITPERLQELVDAIPVETV
jgi:hypothetical protein